MAVRALVFETYGRLGGEGTKLLRDFGEYGGGKWTVQPAWCRTMENPGGTSNVDCCTSRHILASARFQSCGATCY